MKQFDQHFADKVRQVFDEYREDVDPVAWASMNSRLDSRKKSRRVLLYPALLRIAASLLLLSVLSWLTVSLFFPDRLFVADAGMEDSEVVVDREDVSVPDSQIISDTETETMSAPILHIDPVIALAGDARTEPSLSAVPGDPVLVVGTTEKEEGMATADHYHPPVREPNEVVRESPLAMVVEKEEDDHGMATETDTLPGVTSTTPDLQSVAYRLEDTTYPSHEKSMERPVTWGIAAGSMLTYAEQQLAGGLGFSGGITSEYKLSEMLRLSSGVMLAYQQFDVEGMPLSSKRLSEEYSQDLMSVRAYGDLSHEFLAIDIPLNLQLRLPSAGEGQWFLSAGLSSLVYLQQRKSGQEVAYLESAVYDRVNNTYHKVSMASEVDVSAEHDAFSRIDLGRLLNISVGYAIRQEKTTTIIEPFIKYPLGAVSSEEIRMGMGGISLRLTFGK